MTNPPGHQPRPPRPSGRRSPKRRGSAPETPPWQTPPQGTPRSSPQSAGETGDRTGDPTTDRAAGHSAPGTAGAATRTTAPGTAAAGTRPAGEGVDALSPALLEVLRCPLTRGRLFPLDDRHLMSDRPYREGVHPVYEVIEGIPHMLPVQGDPGRSSEPQAPAPQTRGRAS